ncbi:MAG: Gfo/Idh/MocA family oxidoreductase [Clostridia bacterium]|nr:Gfo/Idh/MocA family oxidoreductase [Clostridia bacterium]
MRSAVIGAGNIGTLHAHILSECGYLAAVCDIDESKLSPYGGLALYTDYKKLIDEFHPDVVHICTPHYLHAEMTVYALERGVSVLCEKPLCISYEELEAVLDAEKKSAAMLGVCLQNRYNRETVFVKEYLKDRDVISAVGHVAWHRTAEYYASGSWRGRKATEGGGVLINQALHTLDLLQYFAGMPEKITASVSTLTLGDCIEVEDTAAVIGTKGPGITLFATNGQNSDMPVEISIKTDGSFIKIMPGFVMINGEIMDIGKETYRPLGKLCYGSGHGALIADYYEKLQNGQKFAIDGGEGAKSVRLILAAYRSGGAEVDV